MGIFKKLKQLTTLGNDIEHSEIVLLKLKNDILRKIKDNKNKGVPDIIFDENDSFSF